MRFILDLVTDGFLGGADGKSGPAEPLRPPSLRGLLRFWWRALHGDLSVAELAAREAEIFGTAGASSDDARQGISIRVRALSVHRIPTGERLREASLGYLGYGCLKYDGTREREAIGAGSSFEVTIDDRRLTPAQRTEIAQAVWLLGALGGSGSRARRGFGSLQVAGWVGSQAPARWPAQCRTPDELRQAWSEFLAGFQTPAHSGVPEWTAVSTSTRVFVLTQEKADWAAALDAAGSHLRSFRQLYGVDVKQAGRHGPDHDLAARALTQCVNSAPARAAFGLPHNYSFRGPPRRSLLVHPDGPSDRRASPLFFHVSRLGTGRHVAVVGYIPARFLPQGVRLAVGGKSKVEPPSNGAILEFLDGATIPVKKNGTPATEHWPGLKSLALEA